MRGAVDRDGARRGACAVQRWQDLLESRAGEPRDPDDLAAAHRESDVQRAARGQSRDRHGRLAEGGLRTVGIDRAAHHRPAQIRDRRVAGRDRLAYAAALEHRDAVRVLDDLLEIVRDEQDRHPLLARKPVHRAKEQVGAGGGQEHGGLVENEERALRAELLNGADDRNERPLSVAQIRDGTPRIEVDVVSGEHLAGAGVQPPPVHPHALRVHDAAVQQILCDGEARDESEVLVHEAQTETAERLRVVGRGDRDAAHEDPRARVGAVDAAEDLDEGGLARPVLANQPHDLAGLESEVDPIEGAVVAKRDRRVLDADDGTLAHGCPHSDR